MDSQGSIRIKDPGNQFFMMQRALANINNFHDLRQREYTFPNFIKVILIYFYSIKKCTFDNVCQMWFQSFVKCLEYNEYYILNRYIKIHLRWVLNSKWCKNLYIIRRWFDTVFSSSVIVIIKIKYFLNNA